MKCPYKLRKLSSLKTDTEKLFSTYINTAEYASHFTYISRIFIGNKLF